MRYKLRSQPLRLHCAPAPPSAFLLHGGQQFVLQTAQAGVKVGFSLAARAWCGLSVGGGLRLAPKEGRHAGRLRGESVRGRRLARQPRLLSLLEVGRVLYLGLGRCQVERGTTGGQRPSGRSPGRGTRGRCALWWRVRFGQRGCCLLCSDRLLGLLQQRSDLGRGRGREGRGGDVCTTKSGFCAAGPNTGFVESDNNVGARDGTGGVIR